MKSARAKFMTLAIAAVTSLSVQNAVFADSSSKSVRIESSASFQELRHSKSLSNFGVVSSTLLRGAQPSDRGFAELKKSGVKTIINLRDGKNDIEDEREVVEKLGMKYVSIPMSPLKRMTREHVDQFLSAVRAPENQPSFVHCRHGRDRTGAIVAAYRICEQAWSLPKASAEMLDFGFRRIFVGLNSSVVALAANVSAMQNTQTKKLLQPGIAPNNLNQKTELPAHRKSGV